MSYVVRQGKGSHFPAGLLYSRFSGIVSGRVSGAWEICPTYFEICQTYFELCALYFFPCSNAGVTRRNTVSAFPARKRPFPRPGSLFPGALPRCPPAASAKSFADKPDKRQKEAKNELRLLLLSRGDWIRTSDLAPPRRVL